LSYNGAGIWSANSTGLPVVTNTVISVTMFNAFTADVATGLTTAYTKDGQSTPTANLPMGGFKLTGVGAATVTGDALSFGRAASITTLTITTGLITGLTGLLLGNGASAVTAATAGTDYAKPDTASTWTAKQTFNGGAAALAVALKNGSEPSTISATAATGTIAYNILTQSILYYTSNAAANWTINLRGDGSHTLDSLMATGDVVVVIHRVTQGGTAYYNNVVQVDGTTSGVTTKWLGVAPTAGNINGIDSYRYEIFKTGSATFTVFAAQSPYVT
jgi:hypothetical protein